MREIHKRGNEPTPITRFRMRSSVREKVDASASSVGLNRSQFYRLAVEGALESMSASFSLTGSEKEPLADGI